MGRYLDHYDQILGRLVVLWILYGTIDFNLNVKDNCILHSLPDCFREKYNPSLHLHSSVDVCYKILNFFKRMTRSANFNVIYVYCILLFIYLFCGL